MVFCDSLQFLTQSLQTLVDLLAKCNKANMLTKFSMLKRLIGKSYPAAPWKRLICNNVYLCKYLNIFATLEKQQLLPRAVFHSMLSRKQCIEDD